MAEGDRARPCLERHLEDPDAGRVQAAQIVLGWMDHAESYRLALGYFTGRADPPQRPRGRPLPEQDRIDAVADMAPEIVPRLIELLLKTDEAPFDDHPGSGYGRAWGYLHATISRVINRSHQEEGRFDRRFQEAFAAIVSDETRPMLARLVMADDLRRYFVSDPRWLEVARRAAWDAAVRVHDRAYAFGLLASEGLTQELPRIRMELADPATPEESLRALAIAAERFRDRASVPSLIAVLGRAWSPELRIEVLATLEALRDASAVPHVQEVARSDPDPEVRARADLTLRYFGIFPHQVR
ncbi:MAG: HEAT repeat domain-containing protein [Sandaracinaceae bacterium]|nr:HEAT repeat domain-containing protein [Sandaracinaceae bacterium]